MDSKTAAPAAGVSNLSSRENSGGRFYPFDIAIKISLNSQKIVWNKWKYIALCKKLGYNRSDRGVRCDYRMGLRLIIYVAGNSTR